jgi:hypothetical protein
MTFDLYKNVKEYVEEQPIPNEIQIDGIIELFFSVNK